MATTTISLTAEAYEALARLREKGQSFSDVILEHLRPGPRTCGELLDELERDFDGARLFDAKRIERVRAGRRRLQKRQRRVR